MRRPRSDYGFLTQGQKSAVRKQIRENLNDADTNEKVLKLFRKVARKYGVHEDIVWRIWHYGRD